MLLKHSTTLVGSVLLCINSVNSTPAVLISEHSNPAVRVCRTRYRSESFRSFATLAQRASKLAKIERERVRVSKFWKPRLLICKYLTRRMFLNFRQPSEAKGLPMKGFHATISQIFRSSLRALVSYESSTALCGHTQFAARKSAAKRRQSVLPITGATHQRSNLSRCVTHGPQSSSNRHTHSYIF